MVHFLYGVLLIMVCSLYFTDAKVSCDDLDPGETIWCYYFDMTPSATIPISTHVNISNDQANMQTWFYIYFTPRTLPCLSPSITFSFEQIDYDRPQEYIDVRKVYNNVFLRILTCQGSGTGQCGTFDTCLDEQALPESVIEVDTQYKIELMQPSQNDANCNSLAINARLVFHCAAGTLGPVASPSMSPTRHPTHKPTANPTRYPTHKPTQSPTYATSVPTPAPTNNPTSAPTPAPTTHPTTSAPTTATPTASPITDEPTTLIPTTAIPTTATPTTATPTTAKPTIATPTTSIPTSNQPTHASTTMESTQTNTTQPMISTLSPTSFPSINPSKQSTSVPSVTSPPLHINPTTAPTSGHSEGEQQQSTQETRTPNAHVITGNDNSDLVIIVAIIAALVAFVTALIACAFCYRVRANKQLQKYNHNNVEMVNTVSGVSGVSGVSRVSSVSGVNSDCDVIEKMNINFDVVQPDHTTTNATNNGHVAEKQGEQDMELLHHVHENENAIHNDLDDDDVYNDGNDMYTVPINKNYNTPQLPGNTLGALDTHDDAIVTPQNTTVESENDEDSHNKMYEKGNKTEK